MARMSFTQSRFVFVKSVLLEPVEHNAQQASHHCMHGVQGATCGCCNISLCDAVSGGVATLASLRKRSLSRGTGSWMLPHTHATEDVVLAEEDEFELEAKHRQLQMNLQVICL